jgi:hypothetical protein
MSYNKKYRLRKARLIVLIAFIAVLTVSLISLGYVFYINSSASPSRSSIKDGTGKAEDQYKPAVRAKHKLNPGDPIEADKVEVVQIPSDLAPDNTVESISRISNMLVKHTVEKRGLITMGDLMPKNALYEDDDRLIEHNFPEGAIPASIEAGSMIDIKMFKPGSEDSVVVSKAVVISRDENILTFFLNSREQEYLKESASEGRLFAVGYIDDSQSGSLVTYVPLYESKAKDNKR